MPRKNTKEYNAYMKIYMQHRWERRKAEATSKLGGKCILCGVTSNLQFDHIDPSTKLFTIACRTSASEENFWEEIGKCQLLCESCHKKKTLMEMWGLEKSGIHGDYNTYHKGCRCSQCKEANRICQKRYKDKKRNQQEFILSIISKTS